MPCDPYNHHRRRSIRIPAYDYSSPGAYFVTICVRGGECSLGEVVDGLMRLSAYGRLAHDCWAELAAQFPTVTLDVFTIMPNHVHALVVTGREGEGTHSFQLIGCRA
jgi:putative transposase